MPPRWSGRGLGKVEYISINRIAVGMFLPVVAGEPPYLLLNHAHARYIRWEAGRLGLCVAVDTTPERNAEVAPGGSGGGFGYPENRGNFQSGCIGGGIRPVPVYFAGEVPKGILV